MTLNRDKLIQIKYFGICQKQKIPLKTPDNQMFIKEVLSEPYRLILESSTGIS
jgi:hypothetical protein